MHRAPSPSLPPGHQPPWAKKLVRGLVWLAYGGCRVEGAENFPPCGPLILAPTHRSYLDPIILSAFLPRPLYFMAKRELFHNPLLSAAIRWFGTFPVDREGPRGSTFRQAVRLLEGGGVVVIFPEGGIVGALGENGFKAGLGTLANLTHAPVLPVLVAGSNTLFSWREALSDSPWLLIRVGAPIDTTGARGREGRERTARRTQQALHALAQGTDEAPAACSPGGAP